MKRHHALVLAAALTALSVHAAFPAPGTPGAPDDPRYCGEPVRDPGGAIRRSRTELRRFVHQFPCPATLKESTSCAAWQIDHVIPLADGGCDKAVNMQWLPVAIKTCKSSACKDRWERRYHAIPRSRVTP